MALNFLNDGYFAGKVGIGTASPVRKLHIQDTTGNPQLVIGDGASAYSSIQSSNGLYINAGEGGGGSETIFRRGTSFTESMRINSSGNVGIGVTGPRAKLELGTNDFIMVNPGTGGSAGILFNEVGTPSSTNVQYGARISYKESGDILEFAMRENNVDKLGIAIARSTGNVGIGTTSPGASLHVAGPIASAPTGTGVLMGMESNFSVIHLNGASGGIIDFSTSGVDRKGRILYNNSANYMQIQTNGSDKVRIDSSGNVGIGTTGPTEPLTVSKTASGSTTQIASLVNPVGTANTGVRLWMSGTNTTTRGTFIDAVAESSANDHSLRFGTSASSSTPTERMRITSAGKVGIGTPTPVEQLTVFGQVASTSSSSTVNTAGANRAIMDLTGGGARMGHFRGATAAGSGFLRLFTDSVERMRIDSAGNVGIGTTSPTAKLQVQGNSFFTSDIFTLQNKGIFFNGVGDFSSGIAGINSGTEVRIFAGGSERVRVDDSGNVGIGTGIPNALGFLETGLNIAAGSSSSTTLQQAGLVVSGSSDANDADDFGYLSFTNYQSTLSADRVAEIRINKAGSNVNTGKFHFYTANGTALNESMVLGETGLLRLNQYGAGYLKSDASGNITAAGASQVGPFLPLAGGTMTGVAGVVFPDAFKLNLGTGSDLEIYHNGLSGNNNIDNINGDLYMSQYANDKDIIFRSDNGSGGVTSYLQLDGSHTQTIAWKNIHFVDGVKALFGDYASPDLQIYHDGSNSFIDEAGTGNLFIRSNMIQIRKYTGEDMITCLQDNAVTLYFDNSPKLATSNYRCYYNRRFK